MKHSSSTPGVPRVFSEAPAAGESDHKTAFKCKYTYIYNNKALREKVTMLSTIVIVRQSKTGGWKRRVKPPWNETRHMFRCVCFRKKIIVTLNKTTTKKKKELPTEALQVKSRSMEQSIPQHHDKHSILSVPITRKRKYSNHHITTFRHTIRRRLPRLLL